MGKKIGKTHRYQLWIRVEKSFCGHDLRHTVWKNCQWPGYYEWGLSKRFFELQHRGKNSLKYHQNFQ